MSFALGINYPWVTCGHDFGPRPPAWSGAAPTDWSAVEAELRELRALGLTVARWWIVGGGVNLPAGARPEDHARRQPWLEPWPQWQRPFVKVRGAAERWIPQGPLPALPREFLADFEALLRACAAADVALLPTFISFEALFPLRDGAKGVTSGGRGAWLLGEERDATLDAVFEPLLEVSERYRAHVFAWDVANEPGFTTMPGRRGGPRSRGWNAPHAVGELLVEGARRVARRGLRASVGFVKAEAPWLPASQRVALRRLADSGRYVHQLHHYPRPDETPTLAPADASPIRPVIVGEMATSTARRWFDEGLAEDDDARYLERRIAHVEALGYDGALLWARHASDAQVRWDETVRAQVRRAADGATS